VLSDALFQEHLIEAHAISPKENLPCNSDDEDDDEDDLDLPSINIVSALPDPEETELVDDDLELDSGDMSPEQISVYVCYTCNKRFDSLSSFQSHGAQMHRDSSNTENIDTNEIQESSNSNAQGLKRKSSDLGDEPNSKKKAMQDSSESQASSEEQEALPEDFEDYFSNSSLDTTVTTNDNDDLNNEFYLNDDLNKDFNVYINDDDLYEDINNEFNDDDLNDDINNEFNDNDLNMNDDLKDDLNDGLNYDISNEFNDDINDDDSNDDTNDGITDEFNMNDDFNVDINDDDLNYDLNNELNDDSNDDGLNNEFNVDLNDDDLNDECSNNSDNHSDSDDDSNDDNNTVIQQSNNPQRRIDQIADALKIRNEVVKQNQILTISSPLDMQIASYTDSDSEIGNQDVNSALNSPVLSKIEDSNLLPIVEGEKVEMENSNDNVTNTINDDSKDNVDSKDNANSNKNVTTDDNVSVEDNNNNVSIEDNNVSVEDNNNKVSIEDNNNNVRYRFEMLFYLFMNVTLVGTYFRQTWDQSLGAYLGA